MLRVVYSTISVSVAASLFAEGSHEAADLGKKTKKAARIIGLLLIPVIVIVLLGSNSILGVFGTNYAIHGTALSAILAISVIPDAITNVYVAVLRVQRRLRAAGLLNIGMGVLVIMLAWVLMPRMGINGVGWAWLLGETIGCVAVAIDVVWQRRNSKPATR
jgi:O-antigen/teichoic acid export membrane protein